MIEPIDSRLWLELRKLPRNVWILFAATIVNRAGSMVLPFLALYLTQSAGLALPHTGWVLGVYGLGALIAAPLAGRMSDRIGAIRVLKLSFFFSGATMLAFPLARTLPSLILAALALSIGTEAFRPASLSLIAHLVPPAQRKTAYAVFRLATNLGMSVGPAVGGVLVAFWFPLLFFIDGGTSLAAGVVLSACWLSPAPIVIDPQVKSSSSKALHDRHFLFFLVAIFSVALVFFQEVSTMPLFLIHNLKFSPKVLGLLFSLNTLLIVLFEVLLTHATSRWSQRHTLSLGAFLFGVGFGALVIPGNIWFVAATIVIWTCGEMIFFSTSTTLTSEIAPDGRVGEYLGLLSIVFALAFTVAPWIGILVLNKFGAKPLWTGTFILGMLGAAMFIKIKVPRHPAA